MKKEIESYCRDYMRFLAAAKTERRAYAEAVRLLEAKGFKRLEDMKSLKPGDRVWRGYHGKTLFAAVVGREPVTSGIRVVGGHTDALRYAHLRRHQEVPVARAASRALRYGGEEERQEG